MGKEKLFQEDQAKHRVLIYSGIEIRPEPVGRSPELFIELAEKGLEIGFRHVSGSF